MNMTDYCVVEVARHVLVGGVVRARRPAVFVAYRFDSPESQKFRIDLEAAMRRTAALLTVEVLDGRTFVGEYWPSEVRQRLLRATLTVADLSVLNREVLFECGFAWGLRRPILPVAATPHERARVPAWFTDIEFGHFLSDEGMGHLVDSVAHHVALRQKQGGGRRPKHGKSNPRGVVVVEHNTNRRLAQEQVAAACSEYGMDSPLVIEDPQGLESIESGPAHVAAKASLFVGVLSGTKSDFFVHFAAGAVLSAPTSGESRQHLSKRVLLVVPNAQASETLTPASARKVREVSVITPDRLRSELHDYGEHYKNWQKRLQS